MTETTQDMKKAPNWVSSFDSADLHDLLRLAWSFKPGNLTKNERPELFTANFPEQINLITIGAAGAGKSSYINSLLSLFNPNTEVCQTHSELGTESMTGTVRLEGPFCLNDFSVYDLQSSNVVVEPSRTVLRLWTTMGCSSFAIGTELERQFLEVIKRCFLGTIKPGDYTGMLTQPDYDPLVKRVHSPDTPIVMDKRVPYHLVLIMARYGVQSDADIANHLYGFLSKQNNIPAIVIVTRSEKNSSWDALRDVDPSALFFVENYLPNEKLEHAKSKRLLIPLLEAIKRVERNDVYWSTARESWSKNLTKNISNYLSGKKRLAPKSSASAPDENVADYDDRLVSKKPKAILISTPMVLAMVLVTLVAIVVGVVCNI